MFIIPAAELKRRRAPAYRAADPGMGVQVCTLQWFHLGLRNSLKIATKIWQLSQYLRTNLDILFEISKSVEMVIILGKQLFYPEIVDFMLKQQSTATFFHINLPRKSIFSINLRNSELIIVIMVV